MRARLPGRPQERGSKMPETIRANRLCPVQRVAPALCFNCAIAVRVLDEEGIDELRKKGVKEPEALAWDCPLRMPALYLGELVASNNAVADQLAGIADALEANGFVAKRKAVRKTKAKKVLSSVGGGDLGG